jgi:hypothetical protein
VVQEDIILQTLERMCDWRNVFNLRNVYMMKEIGFVA